MIELEATTEKGGEVVANWKHVLPSAPITLGRAREQSDLAVPQDDLVSRKHAVLQWDPKSGKVQVRVLEKARNPVYYHNQRFASGSEFYASPGERFVIGDSVFQLTEIPDPASAPEGPDLEMERTCSPQDVAGLAYADPDARIQVLSALPELVRQSPSDEEFEKKVVDVLLRGVPRATTAALVYINPSGAGPTDSVHVQRYASRGGLPATPQFSRRLVYSAVCRHRQTVLHRWGVGADADSAFNNPSVGVAEWAICAPLADDAAAGWAVYVAGAETELPLPPPAPSAAQLQDSDLKFVATTAEFIGALRSLRDLQKKQATLSRFFSRTVMAALAGQDMEQVLKPRVTQVTVLCCDLRGSCRIAEEGEANLAETCDRVSAALEEMTTRITEADGVISDFQGDAAMCFWGWPQQRDNDKEQAARAALSISRGFTLLAAKPGHLLAGFACGLGLASGPGVAGRLGTIDQFKIGVFGPTINLAARLESLTKVFRVPIIVDDVTAQQLKGVRQFRFRRLALIQPYGMTRQLLIHELLPPIGSEVQTLSENQRLDYEAALDKFLAGDWQGAERLLGKLYADGPSQFLRTWIKDHKKPPDNWNGVIVLATK